MGIRYSMYSLMWLGARGTTMPYTNLIGDPRVMISTFHDLQLANPCRYA